MVNVNKKINEMTVEELMFIIDDFIKASIKKEFKDIKKEFEDIKKEFEDMKKEFKDIKKEFKDINQKFDYMESEIKTIKLTQNYIKETTNIGLEKPLDSISLASFLADEQEENSFFKLFR